MPSIPILRLPHGADLPLPAYESEGAAGMDLLAAVETALILAPGGRLAVPTGLRIALPPDHEAQIRPRSGLAMRHGLTVANAPGTIDSDYRGEVMVLLINLGEKPVEIRRGDRIAQMVVAPVSRVTWTDLDREGGSLDETARGAGGFGSTGRGRPGPKR